MMFERLSEMGRQLSLGAKTSFHQRNAEMSEENKGSQDFVRIPMFQRILDNPFILLFIGVVVPTVFYVIWGIMEIVTIPIAP